MNDPHQRLLLRRALDCLEQASAEAQASLNDRASRTLEQNPGPIGTGRMIALAQRIESLELAGQIVYRLLDQQPTQPVPDNPAIAA